MQSESFTGLCRTHWAAPSTCQQFDGGEEQALSAARTNGGGKLQAETLAVLAAVNTASRWCCARRNPASTLSPPPALGAEFSKDQMVAITQERDDDWNEELEQEVTAQGVESLVVYSRDWTVETILRQVEQNNIDLNPGFQRRNAWNDLKRSRLIESLVMGIPVPEIVLAEDVTKKKSFIVIDGKQRLLALAGFKWPEKYPSWSKPSLRGLNTRKDLNDLGYAELEKREDDYRQLTNADIRCTVISNYKSNDVLYDIFYRLNTGSVPLGSQELRQVLNRGPFAEYLISATNVTLPLHGVLNLAGPDNRLRDAEIFLRFVAFSLFGSKYGGNLTPFLDMSMKIINEDWTHYEQIVAGLLGEMNMATERLTATFGEKLVGRKFSNGAWENRFNRALYEVEVYYFGKIPQAEFQAANATTVKSEFEKFCGGTPEFLDSIETSTKNLQRYRRRYELFQGFANRVFGTKIDSVPLP